MNQTDNSEARIRLFTPGRVCLFGEHSDWAAGYGEHSGYCLVIGADQGLQATAARCDDFSVRTELPDDPEGRPSRPRRISVPWRDEDLEAVAADHDEFFRYCAGAALVMKRRYGIGGVDLDINRMDLPLKKGVSSSAAVCVQVVSAYDRLYGLGLFPHEIMELAFQGERLTGSACGRMDQACIFGKTPVLLKFSTSGDDIRVDPIFPAGDGEIKMFFVDLAGQKDTVKILDDLRAAYKHSEKLRAALGAENESIVRRACRALSTGAARELGELMTVSQELFDSDIAPHCPEELTSPLLHELLADEDLKQLTFGGKGVGSHGDGSAQFVARDEEARREVFSLIESRHPAMRCFTLDAGSQARISGGGR